MGNWLFIAGAGALLAGLVALLSGLALELVRIGRAPQPSSPELRYAIWLCFGVGMALSPVLAALCFTLFAVLR